MPFTQTTSYTEGDDFPAKAHENALDKLDMLVSQLREEVDRCVKMPITTELMASDTEVVALANRVIGFDSSAGAITTFPTNAGTQQTVDDVGDASASDAEMQATRDPYPGAVISKPSDLRGEIQGLRFLLKQIAGEAQWYIDPGTNLVNLGMTTHGDVLYRGASSATRLAAGTLGQFLQTRGAAANPQWATTPAVRDSSLGLVVTRTNVTTVNVVATQLILTTTGHIPAVVTDINKNVFITLSGAGGLDTGSESADDWYYIYIIMKPDGTTFGLLSNSPTTPTMPSGYTFKALVGAVRNDSGSNFIDFTQGGSSVTFTDPQLMKDGSFATNTWTSQAAGAFFPETAKTITMAFGTAGATLGLSPESTGKRGSYSRAGATGSNIDWGIFTTARANWSNLTIPKAATIYYFVNDANSTLEAIGWEY